MGILRLLFNLPDRKRIQILEASLSLLSVRIDHLEQALAFATFPNQDTRNRLNDVIGQYMTIRLHDTLVRGTLIAVADDLLEIEDDQQRRILIPTSKIISVSYESGGS
ncbi:MULTISPECIES: hypothetical protein [unclassified Paenibacillus]|uniref:hypothetical protein n=1 Tax=unclassified Paenibacillus TaxID=185978 RepID=UPI0008395EF3|nr:MULTISPECIES: hypothetical protein [unclassified Paenibacillus]NWL89838.1 hypothetical protein [Paenibacillus sp. 79R4]